MKNRRPNYGAMSNKAKVAYINRNKAVQNVKKEFKNQINLIMPEIYSAFAIALTNKGKSYEEIMELFGDTQVIWEDLVNKEIDMPTLCLEKTGIDVRAI